MDNAFLYFGYADGKMGVEELSAVAMVTYLLYLETLGFLDKVAMDKEAVFHAVNLWKLFGMHKELYAMNAAYQTRYDLQREVYQ